MSSLCTSRPRPALHSNTVLSNITAMTTTFSQSTSLSTPPEVTRKSLGAASNNEPNRARRGAAGSPSASSAGGPCCVRKASAPSDGTAPKMSWIAKTSRLDHARDFSAPVSERTVILGSRREQCWRVTPATTTTDSTRAGRRADSPTTATLGCQCDRLLVLVLVDDLEQLWDHDRDLERLPALCGRTDGAEPASREPQAAIEDEGCARHVQKHYETYGVADAIWGAVQARGCTMRCIEHLPHNKHGIQKYHYSPEQLKLGTLH
ncbi:unnamed protein product [Prorocentrum cordatum]|uniref:Uncharacterized protein n=1 Tax=Prorocentrum cordatum TaxID=2364126 RepID=A0ABN9SSA6_9DINO|nr:unnamed protein product [Polarella glacialis]